MALMKRITTFLSALAIASFAISCTSDEQSVDEAIKGDDFEVSAPPGEGGMPSFSPVYFDFDRAAIRGQFDDELMAMGKYLAAMPNSSVEVEGHCDSRGTEQYNLALGKRRAESIKDRLMRYGASSNQVKTISYGEERLAVEGNDAASHSMNRRAEFVFKAN